MNDSTTLIALDVGTKRIGIARANSIAKIPEPLQTLNNDNHFSLKLNELILKHKVNKLIVGLPRGLDGQNTQQTQYVLDFVEKLKQNINLDISLQDEALTSVKAKEYLSSTKKKKIFQKSEIDSVSAMFILEDYLKGI